MHSTWAVVKANLKKFDFDQNQICAFQLLKLKIFKNCKPLMVTFVTSGSSHMIFFFICIHLQQKFSLAFGTVSSSEVQMSERVWAEVNCSFNRRDSLELLHCPKTPLLHSSPGVTELRLKIFHGHLRIRAWMSFPWIKLLVQATGKRQKII